MPSKPTQERTINEARADTIRQDASVSADYAKRRKVLQANVNLMTYLDGHAKEEISVKQFLVTAAILMLSSLCGIAHAQTFGVAFEVYGDDEPAVHRIQQAVADEFAQRHFRLEPKVPGLKLVMYVQHDTNDRKNPDGWTIAFAFATNAPTFAIAQKVLQGKGENNDALRSIVSPLLNENGFLTYLSAAHLDQLSDTSIKNLAAGVTELFAKRLPPGMF
jgi:hypothetical protein